MSDADSQDPLLDPTFVRALERMTLEVRRRVRGAQSGERRSQRRGSSVEFAEHRSYTQGDDPRRIDWNAYARLGELVVRLFVAEQDVSLYVLLDASASMTVEGTVKHRSAQRLAAALGYLALHGNERVSLVLARDGEIHERAPLRGRAQLSAWLRALQQAQPEGVAPLAKLASQLLSRNARPGIAVLVSDLYDDAAALQAARKLATARFEVTVVHLLSRTEWNPELSGPLLLRDSETDAKLELDIDARALGLYQQRLRAWVEGIERSLKQSSIQYVRAVAEDDLVDVLSRIVGG